MTSTRNRIVAACAALACVPAVAACGVGGSAPAAHVSVETVAPTPSGAAAPALRWWSDSAAAAGSTIDPQHPDAAAARLHASKTEYCSMLRQTLHAGRSILPGVTAKNPALLASTAAFVAELEAVAPASVAGPWHVLGRAVITLVGSGGDSTKVKGVDAAAVREAASTVAADAKRSCGVDLSS
jgi:hypothetical protein